ncbi:MAG: DUF4390 domain-containing protein [Deltaproteobacteria bacterium]|nr:DUF4390 domain-containing protein [Deltaproteobacteria bacterium]
MKRILYRFIFLILAVFLAFSSPLSAENAEIRDLLVTNNAKHVLVYAKVTNCFTKDIEAAILAGVPTTFTFLLDLFQKRPELLDKKVVRVTVKHTIKYDNVKKLFFVSFDEDKEPTSFQDFESAKRVMADLNGVPVVQLNQLEKNEYYYIRIKAKLDKVRLPLHLEYIFFFVSLWDFETDWYQEGFSHR